MSHLEIDSGLRMPLSNRLVIFQPAHPLYRAEFFELLAARFPNLTLAVHRVYDLPEPPPPKFMTELDVRQFTVRGRSLYWVGGKVVNPPKADLVVLTWDIAYLSLVPAMLRYKMRGSKVVLWGHVYSRGRHTFSSRVRVGVGRLADGLLTYDRESARVLQRSTSRPVYAVGNGLPAEAAIDRSPPSGHIRLLSVSRLNNDRGLSKLIAGIAGEDVSLVVVGDGQARHELQDLASWCGADVRFLGALYPGSEVLEEEFERAHFFALPEGGGLGFVHSLHKGLPVITRMDRQYHGPEFEYLDATNSIGIGPAEIAGVLDRIRKLSAAEYSALIEGCRATAVEASSAEFAQRFGAALESILGD